MWRRRGRNGHEAAAPRSMLAELQAVVVVEAGALVEGRSRTGWARRAFASPPGRRGAVGYWQGVVASLGWWVC
jgi:hypothetical protein